MNPTIIYQEIRPEDIYVDSNYQRVARSTVNKIVESFDELRFGTPDVAMREDGRFYVIDGQHRIKAARQLSIPFVMCRVIKGITVAKEAELFADQGMNRTQVTSMEKLKAALTTGDTTNGYVYIHNAAKRLDLDCVSVDGHHVGVRCIELMKELYDNHGSHCIDFILSTIVDGGWAGNYDAYSRFWTHVFGRLFQTQVNTDRLTAFLSKRLPVTVLSESPRSGVRPPSISDVVRFLAASCR